jgi:tetratricopeptide (TPR) repeat protein
VRGLGEILGMRTSFQGRRLWGLLALGMAAALGLMLVLIRPGANELAVGSSANPGELSAASVGDYLIQIRAGTAAYRAQRFAEAIQAFETAIALQASEPLTYRYLAELYWRTGRPEQVQQAVRSLASALPDAYALDQVGRLYEEDGLTWLAMQVYRQAVGLDPQFPGARYNLGRAYLEAGQLERGIGEMQATLRLYPDFPEAHQALGMAYVEQGRVDDALVHLQRALALAPDLTVVRNYLGRTYLAQGRLEEAIQTFRSLVERVPGVVEARHNLAVAYARHGLQTLAVEQFREAVRLQPDFHAARLDLAALLLEMGRIADAIDTLEAAPTIASSTLEPAEQRDLVDIRYRLGLAYSTAGRQRDAIQEMEAVLQAQPTHAGAHASLGRLYFQLHQFAQAWRYARRAESLGLPMAELLAALHQVSVEPP